MQRVIERMNFVIWRLLPGWDADEAVAVVGQMWGAIEPPLVQHRLEHRQRTPEFGIPRNG